MVAIVRKLDSLWLVFHSIDSASQVEGPRMR